MHQTVNSEDKILHSEIISYTLERTWVTNLMFKLCWCVWITNISHFHSRTFTTKMQPVVLCLASTPVAVWRQNGVLKNICCLKSTGRDPDTGQNRAAESLGCSFPSQCSQTVGLQLHNAGYENCWWWDFQPNVASAAARRSSSTSVFSGQQEQTLCSLIASSECWFEGDEAPFYLFYLLYFLTAQIPSTEDTNCPRSLTFKLFTFFLLANASHEIFLRFLQFHVFLCVVWLCEF